MSQFFKIHLRTLDVPAARAFYASVLGPRAADLDMVQLHEQAIARGAPPHWLGYLEVGDVAQAADAFVARGALVLAKWVNPEGLEAAVVRDPGGAIMALARPSSPTQRTAERDGVIWHHLHTADVERAKLNYGELFGWIFEAPVTLGDHAVAHPFAGQTGAPSVGWMSDIAAREGVHPHWLFHLRVDALDLAVRAVRAGGGFVLGPFTLPNGEQIAICDDPQGAAFALHVR